MTNGASPVDDFACEERGLAQMEEWKRPETGLGVFVKKQSLSDLEDAEDLRQEWEQLDPTSDILEAVNSEEFTGVTPAPELLRKEHLHPDFEYYGYGYGQAQSPESQMYGSLMWQSMQQYPYFDQWQAATSSFISAFGGYDFVPKGRRRGKQDMWIAAKGLPQEKRPPTVGVDASDPRRIIWTLEKASLTSKNKDREKVSPSFRIWMGGQEVEFKLNLFATSVSSNRHCSSFKKAKGKGHVALRCVQSINDCTEPSLTFRVILGEGYLQTSKLMTHNFAEKQICTVPPGCGGEEEWDFLNADADKPTFVIVLEMEAENL